MAAIAGIPLVYATTFTGTPPCRPVAPPATGRSSGELIVVVPSRGRPHNIAELVASWDRTRTADSHLWVIVDDDDPQLDGYHRVAAESARPWWSLTVGPRRRLGPTLNDEALIASGFGHVGFMGDDHRPRTIGWDAKIIATIEALPLAVVYGDDLVQRQNLATAVFMHADVVARLGYMVAPGLVHMYIDDFWMLLGNRLGTLTYLPDVVIEHCHPVAGTAPSDAGYVEVNAPEMYSHGRTKFREFVDGGEFDKALARVLRTGYEARLFPEGTIPECSTAEWYLGRESAPHIDQPAHQPRMKLAAEFVADLVADLDADAVVDAGAGDGGMLSMLDLPSYVFKYGYELSPAAVATAEQRGVPVYLADVVARAAEQRLIGPSDDKAVVIATEMIEHLVDPHQFVADLFADGRIVAVVASSPWNETADNHYEFHLWAWDDDGYRSLFERAGWKVQRQERAGFATVLAAVRP
jgi:hypothetical protein